MKTKLIFTAFLSFFCCFLIQAQTADDVSGKWVFDALVETEVDVDAKDFTSMTYLFWEEASRYRMFINNSGEDGHWNVVDNKVVLNSLNGKTYELRILKATEDELVLDYGDYSLKFIHPKN